MNDSKYYCDMTALTTEERNRYPEYEKLFSNKVKSITEQGNGYALSFTMEPATFILVAEFVTFERRCCPFLNFVLNIESGEELAVLEITGPEDAKPFIRAELGLT